MATHLKVLTIIVIAISILSAANSRLSSSHGSQNYGEKCNPKNFGSECQNGLKCHNFLNVCLKDAGVECEFDLDCYSEMCLEKVCLNAFQAYMIRMKKRVFDNLWSWE